MKDNMSLVAAAAGGFMVSVALTGILRGAPVSSVRAETHFNSSTVAYVHVAKGQSREELVKKNY